MTGFVFPKKLTINYKIFLSRNSADTFKRFCLTFNKIQGTDFLQKSKIYNGHLFPILYFFCS